MQQQPPVQDRCDARLIAHPVLTLGRAVLEDIRAGRPVRRRDAVRLARAVREGDAVLAAEAVLEADDRELLARLVELLHATLDVNAEHVEATARTP